MQVRYSAAFHMHMHMHMHMQVRYSAAFLWGASLATGFVPFDVEPVTPVEVHVLVEHVHVHM